MQTLTGEIKKECSTSIISNTTKLLQGCKSQSDSVTVLSAHGSLFTDMSLFYSQNHLDHCLLIGWTCIYPIRTQMFQFFNIWSGQLISTSRYYLLVYTTLFFKCSLVYNDYKFNYKFYNRVEKIDKNVNCLYFQRSIQYSPEMYSQTDKPTVCCQDRGCRQIHFQPWTLHRR